MIGVVSVIVFSITDTFLLTKIAMSAILNIANKMKLKKEIKIKNTLMTNVTEEIADVLITIENIKYLLSIPDSKINNIIKYKIDRYIINKMY